MIIDRRAYYNLLRMGWYDDDSLDVEPWQVENYRTLELEEIFDRLKRLDVTIDRIDFVNLSEDFDNPEDLTDSLVEEEAVYDQVYLLIFELWRRLLPEKQCLTIFCDELDQQIYLYEQDLIEDFEPLQDAIANLQMVLDENADQGANPQEVFGYIKTGCASDLEAFFYDFISLQIDDGNIAYATDLLDNLSPYVEDVKWFTFLKIRLLGVTDPPAAKLLIRQIVVKAPADADIDFNLEILSYLVHGGDRDVFNDLLKQTLPLIETEEDFQDLLEITADYFRCLDQERVEKAIQKIIDERQNKPQEGPVRSDDPHFSQLLKVVFHA